MALPLVLTLSALVFAATGCTAVGPEAASTSSAAAAPTTPASSATTPSGVGASQTKAAACQILGSSLQDLSSSLQTAYSKYASDPKAAVTALQKVSDTFATSVRGVTEPGAQALTAKAEADLQTLIADVTDAVDHPLAGAAKVQKLLPTIQADFTKIGTYCS